MCRAVRYAAPSALFWRGVGCIFFSTARLALVTCAFASTVVWSAVSRADPGACPDPGDDDAVECAGVTTPVLAAPLLVTPTLTAIASTPPPSRAAAPPRRRRVRRSARPRSAAAG